jgi:histidinol-phosphate aminotransferase
VRNDVWFGASNTVVARAADELEIPRQPEVVEDAMGESLRLRGSDSQANTPRLQAFEDLLDALEHSVLGPAGGVVALEVRAQGLLRAVLRQAHHPERVDERWPDHTFELGRCGFGGADGLQRVAKSGEDSRCRIGECSIEIEEHNRGTRAVRCSWVCHDKTISVTAATTLIGNERILSAVDSMALLRHHGDVEVGDGLMDFAVNVQGLAPPDWLTARIAAALTSLGSYPSAAADLNAREAIARRHRRSPDEVLLLSGGAEGFAMLPRLRPRLAAVVHPSFTEPEVSLREASVPIVQVMLAPPYTLDTASVPEEADLVVIGNPTNPTSVLHERSAILALRRPGRVLVVDEAFADAVPGERESVAGDTFDDIVVLRSLTKTWALAGLRCGYALGHPDVLAALTRGRAHWPVGTLQIEAIAACSEPRALEIAAAKAEAIGADRRSMAARLESLGIEICGKPQAPFLLLKIPAAEQVRSRLRADGVAVRRCDTFPGLAPGHLRVAVRPPDQVDLLIEGLQRALPRRRM